MERNLWNMPLWGTPALIMWLCVFSDSFLRWRTSICTQPAHMEAHKSQRWWHVGTNQPAIAHNTRGPRWSRVPPPAALFSLECCFYFLVRSCGAPPRGYPASHTRTNTHTLELFTHPCPRTTFEKTASDRCPKQKGNQRPKTKKKQKEKTHLSLRKKRVFLSFSLSPPLSMCSFCLLVYNGPLWDDDLPLMVKQTLNNLGNLLSGRVGSEYWYQSAASEQLGLAQRLLTGHNSSVAPSNRSKSKPQ